MKGGGEVKKKGWCSWLQPNTCLFKWLYTNITLCVSYISSMSVGTSGYRVFQSHSSLSAVEAIYSQLTNQSNQLENSAGKKH